MIPSDLLFLLFHMGQANAERGLRKPTPPKRLRRLDAELRGDVPTIARPPDRDAWEREHGLKPFPLRGFPILRMRARRCIARDLSTIDRDKAIAEHAKLEHICERVKTAAGKYVISAQGEHLFVENRDHVFFDPSDGRFWVYPEGKNLSGTQESRNLQL